MRKLLASLAVVSLVSVAAAQTLPCPLERTEVGAPAGPGETRLEPRPASIRALLPLQRVTLTDVPLADGRDVVLELERIDLAAMGFGIHVDGEPREGLIEGLNLSLWKGRVAGEPDSIVRLGFSDVGTRGWIRTGNDLVHVVPRPADGLDWTASDVVMVTARTLAERGAIFELNCETAPFEGPEPDEVRGSSAAAALPVGGTGCKKACPVAVETDHELFQVFGDLPALSAYVVTLMGFVSDTFETEVETLLTYPYVGLYTDPDDPWSSQTGAGNCSSMLNELTLAWTGQIPGGARVGHFLSGFDVKCGIAWLNVLCNYQTAFSVTDGVDGKVNFPVVQQPDNWDFYVAAHELGHNFGAKHTHEYCEPLDECAPPPFTGPCQTSVTCSESGTLMSYCYYCPGREWNIVPTFHPMVRNIMRKRAQNCLPDCPGGGVGTNFCTATPNSRGIPAILSANGTSSVGEDDLRLLANLVPQSTPGVFFFGGDTVQNSLRGRLPVRRSRQRRPVPLPGDQRDDPRLPAHGGGLLQSRGRAARARLHLELPGLVPGPPGRGIRLQPVGRLPHHVHALRSPSRIETPGPPSAAASALADRGSGPHPR